MAEGMHDTDLPPNPDPRFEQFPIPDTVDEVVARIVTWVQLAVRDEGGPAYEFNRNQAEIDFKKIWGGYVADQLARHPGNTVWSAQWTSVVHIAKHHGQEAVRLAREKRHTPVSPEDFIEAGKLAAGECYRLYIQTGIATLGCWCNNCDPNPGP